MRFKFTPDDLGRSKIVLMNQPDWIVSLPIAPTSIEECLCTGRWLVVSMSVWSIHDIEAGHRAIELVNYRAGLLKLGLRPFDYPQEHTTWIPGFNTALIQPHSMISETSQNGSREATITGRAESSPVWVVIANGQIAEIQFGRLSNLEIDKLIDRTITF